jgi:hypothetical protein
MDRQDHVAEEVVDFLSLAFVFVPMFQVTLNEVFLVLQVILLATSMSLFSGAHLAIGNAGRFTRRRGLKCHSVIGFGMRLANRAADWDWELNRARGWMCFKHCNARQNSPHVQAQPNPVHLLIEHRLKTQ